MLILSRVKQNIVEKQRVMIKEADGSLLVANHIAEITQKGVLVNNIDMIKQGLVY